MFEFNKLCNECEKLSTLEKGVMLTEKSVSVLRRLRQAEIPGIDPVETLAAFIVGSVVSDGVLDEKSYLYMYPSLVKAFGSDFDFVKVKSLYKTAKDVKKEIERHSKDLIKVVGADENLKADIISLCLMVTAIDGKISFKEKRYIKQLCRARNK